MNWTMVILKLQDEAQVLVNEAEKDEDVQTAIMNLTVSMVLSRLASSLYEGTRIE